MAWPSIAIFIAVFFAVFGLAAWYLERVKGRAVGLILLLGLPGVYLAGLPFYGGPRWLLAPGLVLLVASYVVQFLRR